MVVARSQRQEETGNHCLMGTEFLLYIGHGYRIMLNIHNASVVTVHLNMGKMIARVILRISLNILQLLYYRYCRTLSEF